VVLPLALAESSGHIAEIYRLLTWTLVLQGRVDDAAELVDFATRGMPDEDSWPRAYLRLAGATVAAAKGNKDVAMRGFVEALSFLEGLDLPIDLSEGRIAYGRALRELGEMDLAREQFELARATSAAIGATGLVGEVDRELTLVGSRAG
jgi:tetratricopeptide (TPR) repeat protein